MNRHQRREAVRQGMVNLRDVIMPPHMTLEECAIYASMRIRDNALETGHPYHHRTASGVIVTPDPSLEYVLKRLKSDARYQDALQAADALAEVADRDKNITKAIPVNRRYYGHDPYAVQ